MNQLLKKYLNSPVSYYGTELATFKNINDSADKNALSLFHKAAQRVPAYRDFLNKNHLKSNLVKTIEDFSQVPPITKENYILNYNLPSRCFDGDLTQTHAFSASSGSTGEPMFWPRQLDQEVEGAMMHELLFDKVFSINQKKTLVINAFGLGNWIAGMFTHNSAYLVRLHGLNFTLASPGYNQEEVFKVIRQYSPHYDQTILICHPPIIKMMVEAGINEGINWKKLNVKFLGAAEGFSENWRDYLLGLVDQVDPHHSLINIYGSADAGLMGFETPLSISIHREANTNHDLNRRLFASERKPYLYQFDPRLRYIQATDNEITITMSATMPLIRYNIHDHGNVIPFDFALEVMQEFAPDFLQQLKDKSIDSSQWRLPFVYIFGRNQFMTTLYGVNIYPENIKSVLDHESLQPYLTGRFTSEKNQDSNQDQYMSLRLELKPGIKETKKLKQQTLSLFIQTLRQINSEYNQVEQKFHDKMHPHIKFHAHHHPTYFPEGKTIKSG